jgi:hypothetical protein
MRYLSLVLLILSVSCAQHDRPDRAPSSEAEIPRYGDHDSKLSTVKQFPPKYEEKLTRYYFFVELKDEGGSYVDRDLNEFEMKDKKKAFPVKVKRVLRGRYYVILASDKNLPITQLDFYVAGIKLKESFRLGLKTAHPKHTKILKLHSGRSFAKLELHLKDEKGEFVDAPEPPEIVLDSDVEITKLEHMGNGIWHIWLRYPYENQLFYISVRSHGVEFKKLFRFQYIDE